MSATELYVFRKRGKRAEQHCEFRNSWGGAMYVWGAMAKRYMGCEVSSLAMRNDGGMQRLWDLSKRADVEPRDRVVMASTFDAALVKREDFNALADLYDEFAATYPANGSACSLPDQAKVLRQLAIDKTIVAVGWNQTSVNADVRWQPWDHKRDREGTYDLAKATDHFFVDVGSAAKSPAPA